MYTVKSGLVAVQIGTAMLVKVSVFAVNRLQLQVLDCLDCDVGCSNLQRKLTIICRSAWNDIRTYFNV